MPGHCPAAVVFLRFACGKYSAPSRTRYRWLTKTVRLPTGTAFAFRPECCSESHWNGVRLQTGIAFAFNRIPQRTISIEDLRSEARRRLPLRSRPQTGSTRFLPPLPVSTIPRNEAHFESLCTPTQRRSVPTPWFREFRSFPDRRQAGTCPQACRLGTRLRLGTV